MANWEGPDGAPMDSEQDGHLTRLDCALDDRNSCVPLSRIRQAIATGQGVTRADRMQRTSSSSIHKAIPSGETLYLGSPHSQTLLRIYDKRLELQAKEREEWQDYGIRWELELKKDRAQVCGQVLSYLEETDWLEFIVAYFVAMWTFEPRVVMKRKSFGTGLPYSTGGSC